MSTRNDWDRATEESLRSGGLALLRPEPPELDEEWVDSTLTAIRRDVTAPRPSRRWKRLVVGATAVVVATGGVAAAAVSAPSYLEHTWTRFLTRADKPPAQPEVSVIADVRLPGGGRFTAWRAMTQEEMCSASADNWDGADKIGSGGMGCGEIDPEAADRDLQLFDYAFSPDPRGDWYYPVVYGAPADPRDASVTHVHVHGRLVDGSSWHRDAVLDPGTRGFGVVVPGARPRSSMQEEWDTPSGRTFGWDSDLRSIVIDLLDDRDRLVRSITVLDVGPGAFAGRH